MLKKMASDTITKSLPPSIKIRNITELITRPNASSGYWLCTLIPLCFLVNVYRYPLHLTIFEYKILTIYSVGFCLQSIFFYLHLIFEKKIALNPSVITSETICTFYTFVTGIITSLLIFYICKSNGFLSIILYGFGVIFIYHHLYFKILKCLPKSFTLGEASICVQCVLLFVFNYRSYVREYFTIKSTVDIMYEIQAIMTTALFALIIFGLLINFIDAFKQPIYFYLLLICYILFVCFVPLTKDLPIITILKYLIGNRERIFIMVYYLILVAVTILSINLTLRNVEKASTSIRKIFHIIIVLVYIPGLLYQYRLLYIGSGIALAFLILLEIIRFYKIPPFYKVLIRTNQLFVDEKDSGYIALTPIYLLCGCSLPLWITPSPFEIQYNVIQLLSGVITIGIGDTAASVIGSKFGKTKLLGTNKSIEGTIANITAQCIIVFILVYNGYVKITLSFLIFIPLAIIITSTVEAYTDQIDNLILPLLFYIISCLA